MKALSIITFLAALAVAIISPKAAAALCAVAFIFTIIAIVQEGPGLQK